MIRFLINAVVFFAAAAIGLIAADLILDESDFSLTAGGFIITVAIFAIAQAVLSPFIARTVQRNAPAFLGGIGIVSTIVALFLASLFGSALEINGIATWILAALIVWLVTAFATLMLPLILVKAGVERARENRA